MWQSNNIPDLSGKIAMVTGANTGIDGAAILARGIDFNNPRLEKQYDPWQAYAVSKLASLLFTYELNKRLISIDSTVISVAAHPEVTQTDLQRHISRDELCVLQKRTSKNYRTLLQWKSYTKSYFRRY